LEGTIAGTPTESGDFTFDVQVTDSNNEEATTEFVIEISGDITDETSPNWSGYEVDGGPFTSVSGTFTVPSLTTASTCDERLSEWVGVDGGSNDSGTLIQAGVDESSIDPSTGACNSNEFYIWPWWEILPASSNPDYSVSVSAGDSVTVTIQQVGSGLWQMSLADNTDGQGFSVQEPFNGSGQTAEWITEAFADNTCGNGIAPAPGFPGYAICPIAPYNPPVTFSGLQLPQSSSATAVDAITMTQDEDTVSTPSGVSGLSDLLANGFTDTYTG
jgi:hypothetical protein